MLQLIPPCSRGAGKASWPALQPGGWHSRWRGSPALRGARGRSPPADGEETQASRGAGSTHVEGVQRKAQRLSHPGCSALERSMGTAAQRKSVPHYPPRLPTDPGSVTSHSLYGPGQLASHQPSNFCTTSPASAAGQTGTRAGIHASGGNSGVKMNCSLHQQAEEASSESREQGWLLHVQRVGRQTQQNSGEVFSLIVSR